MQTLQSLLYNEELTFNNIKAITRKYTLYNSVSQEVIEPIETAEAFEQLLEMYNKRLLTHIKIIS